MVGVPTRPRAQGYGVQIGEEWFRIAPSSDVPLNIYTQDSLAPRQENRASVEENVLDLGIAWSRSNLTGGEGMDRFPRGPGEQPQETDAIRFWDSSNVEINRPKEGDPYSIKLSTVSTLFTTPASAPVDMAASIDHWWYIGGTSVFRFDDFANTVADDTDNLADGNLVQIEASADNQVAVLTTSGDIWYKGANTNTYLKVYDQPTQGFPAQAIWLVKGRIIAATRDTASAGDGRMLEIAPVIGGTPATPTQGATVITIVDTFTQTMNACVDAGHAIVAAFADGSLRSYVTQTDTQGGSPDLTVHARTQVPRGENPYALAWNMGTLLILTIDSDGDHVRLYKAEVLDERFDFVVGDMQLLRTWTGPGETAPNYTKAMVATRDSILFWMEETDNVMNMWRYDLVTAGLVRERGEARTGVVSSVVFEDVIGFIDGTSIYVSSTTDRVAEGYLISPILNLGLNTTINWAAFVLAAKGLASNAKVEFYYSIEPEVAILNPTHASWISIQTLSAPGHSGVEQTKVGISSNTLALKIVLKRGSFNNSPEVTRIAVRGIPAHRDWIAEVPINVSDMVEAPGRAPYRVPGLGHTTHSRLFALSGLSVTLTLLQPPMVLHGVVHRIAEPTAYTGDRGSVTRVAVLQFRGSRTGATISDEGQSLGVLGLGIGQVGTASVGVLT